MDINLDLNITKNKLIFKFYNSMNSFSSLIYAKLNKKRKKKEEEPQFVCLVESQSCNFSQRKNHC